MKCKPDYIKPDYITDKCVLCGKVISAGIPFEYSIGCSSRRISFVHSNCLYRGKYDE